MKTPRLISFKLAQKIIIREKKKLFQESKIKLKEARSEERRIGKECER